jgi:ferredoxin
MSVEKEIMAEAQRLFDTAGIARHDGNSILILGLVTNQQRNLDDFLRDENGIFRFRGFEIHAQPKLDLIINFIRQYGLKVEVWGQSGYPRGEELNLKRQAVAAGLGQWGKNSVVIHPKFGPWLRLMAVKVGDTALSPTGPGKDNHEENPLCKDCTACIDACPLGILEPYYLRDRINCLSSISKLSEKGKLTTCDLCLEVCPIGQ